MQMGWATLHPIAFLFTIKTQKMNSILRKQFATNKFYDAYIDRGAQAHSVFFVGLKIVYDIMHFYIIC